MGYHGDVATYVPLLWKQCFCMRRSRGRMWCPGNGIFVVTYIHVRIEMIETGCQQQ